MRGLRRLYSEHLRDWLRADQRGRYRLLGSSAGSGFFLSVLTMGEIRKGGAMGQRAQKAFADQLSAWIDTIETAFDDRILPIDTDVARRWGELAADRTRPLIDTLLVATALRHGLTLVTRNTIDVRRIDVAVLDPFT